MPFDVVQLAIIFGVLLFSLSIHESAHAWTAWQLGDPTARRLGRVSLNPAVHIDPVGTVLMPLAAFLTGAPIIGWAKPVPVNGIHLAHPRRDMFYVAVAGPVSNVMLAALASLVMRSVPATPIDLGIGPALPIWNIASVAFELNANRRCRGCTAYGLLPDGSLCVVSMRGPPM